MSAPPRACISVTSVRAQGNRLRQGKYVESWSILRAAGNGPRTAARLQQGNALYHSPSSTGGAGLRVTDRGGPALLLRAGSHYNAGNTRYQAGTTRPRPGLPLLLIIDLGQGRPPQPAMALRSQKNPPKQCPNPKKDQTRRTRTRKTTGQAKQDQGKPGNADAAAGPDAGGRGRIMSAAAEKEKSAQQEMMRQRPARRNGRRSRRTGDHEPPPGSCARPAQRRSGGDLTIHAGVDKTRSPSTTVINRISVADPTPPCGPKPPARQRLLFASNHNISFINGKVLSSIVYTTCSCPVSSARRSSAR